MLNTYRVISLSLVTALFFAAPLLCVQPISFQIKKASSLAVNHRQSRRGEFAWQAGNNSPQIKPARALAKSLYRAQNVNYERTERSVAPQTVLVHQEAENWDDKGYQLQYLDDTKSAGGFSNGTGVSDNHIYY